MSLPPYSTRPTLRIDLAQIKSNYEMFKDLAPRAKVAAAVKADAYGLGAESVGRTLYGAGCRIYFVATAGEGKILRDAIGPNAAIYVLNGPAPRDKAALLGSKLKPVINSIGQARYWADIASEVNEPPYTAIHIETGMNRMGMPPAEVAMLANDRALWRILNPEWIMSHLACASISSHPMNAEQLKNFKALSATLPPTPLSLSGTAGIYLGKDYHFQLVRPGIGLYGGMSTDKPEQEQSKPVVKLLAPILQLHEVKAGESIGYNATHVAKRDMRLATIGAGYADGVPVSMSNIAHAVIHDEDVPIVGRVSMDMTILDVTDVHMPVQVGGVAMFLGDRLEAQAEAAGTINYELLVRLGQRVRRDYWKPRSGDNEDGQGTAQSKASPHKSSGPSKSSPKHPSRGPSKDRKPDGNRTNRPNTNYDDGPKWPGGKRPGVPKTPRDNGKKRPGSRPQRSPGR